MSEEKPVEPFSDLHVEDDHVRATLLHDPTIEALDMALYLDGSGSMNDEYEYKKKGGFLAWLLQKKDRNELVNQVEPQAQWMQTTRGASRQGRRERSRRRSTLQLRSPTPSGVQGRWEVRRALTMPA